jgi:hypothetical protein
MGGSAALSGAFISSHQIAPGRSPDGQQRHIARNEKHIRLTSNCGGGNGFGLSEAAGGGPGVAVHPLRFELAAARREGKSPLKIF